MGELQVLPDTDDLLPEGLRSGLRSDRVEDGVDDGAGTEGAEQFRVAALRTVLLDVGDQLHQRGGEGARVARELCTGGVSAGLTRADDEKLNQLRHLAGGPEDHVHQHVGDERRQNGRVRTDAEETLQPLEAGDPGANALVRDEEEDGRKHGDHRVDADVVVVDVAQLVSEHGFDFLVGHAAVEETFGGGDDGLAMDGTSREGIRQRIRRHIDRRLELELALGIDAVDDVDQALVRRVARVSRFGLGHHDRDLGGEPPHHDREKQPERAEAELELVGEVEDPEGAVDEAAHGKESGDRHCPRLEETLLDRRSLRVIMRNYAMTSHIVAPSIG